LERKAASGVMLISLLAGVLTLAFSIQRVESENASLLWNYTTGHRVRAVFVSPNNEYAVAGSDDKNVYSLDLTTGQVTWSYHTGEWSERVATSIFSVSASPDNEYVIAGTASNVYCLNATSGNRIWNFTISEAWSVFVSPDSEYVIAGSFDGYVYSLGIADGALNWAYPAGGYVFSVFVSLNNEYILAGYAGGVIALDKDGSFLWNYATNGYVPPRSLFVSPNNNHVVAGSAGLGPDYGRGRIYALNITDGIQIWNYTATGPFSDGASNIPINSVSVSSDNRFVVAGAGNGITSYLDITDGHLIWEYDTGSYMWDVAISPNCEYVVTASVGSRPPFPDVPPNVFLLRATDGSEMWNYSTPATSISITPDSTRIVVGSIDHNVYAFEAPSLTPPVVTATVCFDPGALNLRSKGKWITAHVQLPEDYSLADIDTSTVLLNDTVSPILDSKYGFVKKASGHLVDHNGDGVLELLLKFDKSSVASLIYQSGGMRRKVSLIITGQLADGAVFEGTAAIFAFGQGYWSPSKR
jgi:outer membrane protein assembly factor BamB